MPGRMTVNMILVRFIMMPEAPFPTITAPTYSKGKHDASPKTWPCTIPFTPPKNIRIKKQAQKAVSGSSIK